MEPVQRSEGVRSGNCPRDQREKRAFIKKKKNTSAPPRTTVTAFTIQGESGIRIRPNQSRLDCRVCLEFPGCQERKGRESVNCSIRFPGEAVPEIIIIPVSARSLGQDPPLPRTIRKLPGPTGSWLGTKLTRALNLVHLRVCDRTGPVTMHRMESSILDYQGCLWKIAVSSN